MKRLFLVAALSATLPAMAQNVATVNGHAITQAELDSTLKALRIENASPEQRKSILDEIISRDVLSQEAVKLGLDKKDDVKANLEAARKDILISSLLQDWSEKNKVTDDDIKKAYDDMVKEQAGKKEFKVSHILVKEEDKAKALLADIKAKKVTFEDAAKKDSIDPGSGKNGGDLGWSNPDMYVPEFTEAVKTGKKGEISEPVKSQYGYHLVRIDDERPVTPPTLDQVKTDLTRSLTQKKMFEFVESLRSKAKIEIIEK